MNFIALLACLAFYSALYLLYFFFAKQQNPLLLLAAIGMLCMTVLMTPYPFEKRRYGFDATLNFGNYLYWPLYIWWRVFTFPIRWLLSLFFHD